MKKVLENELTLFATDPRTATVHDFGVSLGDLRATASAPHDQTLSLGDAASALAVDTRTIRALIYMGYLCTASPFSRHRWRIITRSSVTAFEREHISLKALSIKLDKSPASLGQLLLKQGHNYLEIRPKVQRIFRRSEVL